jgi:hypothetical protein
MSSKNLDITTDQPQQITKTQYKKMIFIQNALDQGWSIKKSQDSYIFTKKHENRREIFQENYLETFLVSNFSNNPLESKNLTKKQD